MSEGKIADLLVVKGNPVDDITVLQQRSNLLAVMKDGAFVECQLECATPSPGGRPRVRLLR